MSQRPTLDSLHQASVSTGPTPPSRFRGLDGLRALAVVAVLVFHLTPGALPGGFIGVDVFFVLSGFLITGLLLREHDATGSISLRAFWIRRARRLLPALATVVLVCGAIAAILGGDLLVGFGRQLLGAATFSSNWLDIGASDSYFDQTSPQLFLTFWSLAVEEQFYLLWPLVMIGLLVIPSLRLRGVIIAALAIASAVAMAILVTPGSDPTRVYYGTDTHSFGLAIGAFLGVIVHRRAGAGVGWGVGWSRRARVGASLGAIIGLSGIAAATVVLGADDLSTYRGGLVAVALCTALCISGAIVPSSVVGRLLDIAPLRWVGERSYGLYLWHWPVFALVQSAVPTVPRDGAGAWMLGTTALLISVVCAIVSHRYIETPVRRDGFGGTARSWWTSARGSTRGAVVTAAVGALALGALTGTGVALASTRDDSDARIEIEQGRRAVDDAAEATPPSPAAQQPASASSTPTPTPTGDQITAIGDSVMLASAPELQAAFPGIAIDAVVSRQMSEAEALIADLDASDQLRPIVVLGLGTNGPIDRPELDGIRDRLSPDHELVLVSVQAPRGWTEGVNIELSRFAQQYRDVELASWRDAISLHLDLLARDQIHPGSRGGQIYAETVDEALQRLAALPPLLRQNDYGLAPLPQ